MKYATQLLLAPLAAAFPAAILDAAAKDPAIAARAAEILNEKRQVTADGATKVFELVPIFNEKAQFVDVGPGSGHEYVAPGPNDLRGPCPGLNGGLHIQDISWCTADLHVQLSPITGSCHTMDTLRSHSSSTPQPLWSVWDLN